MHRQSKKKNPKFREELYQEQILFILEGKIFQNCGSTHKIIISGNKALQLHLHFLSLHAFCLLRFVNHVSTHEVKYHSVWPQKIKKIKYVGLPCMVGTNVAAPHKKMLILPLYLITTSNKLI